MGRVATSTGSLIKNRIVETGKSFTGAPLPAYTPGYLQFKTDVGRYRGHVDLQLGNYSIAKRIQAVQARKKKKKRADALTAAEQKVLTRFRTKQKVATSSTLWNSVGIVEKIDQSFLHTVRIAPRDDINKKKAKGLERKRGNILTPSKSEKDQAQGDYSKAIFGIIKKNFE